jgi:3-phenylpropionate/cinnamic acid dioxygenase small subunit
MPPFDLPQKSEQESTLMKTNEVKEVLGTGVVIEAIQSMSGADSIEPDHMGRGRQPSQGYIPKAIKVDAALQRQVEELLFHQAALLDNKAWSDFGQLFSDDGVYWMPSTPTQTDWRREPSIFAEDKLLMEVRASRLLHPNAWSQAAQWGTNHIVGNIVIEAVSNITVEVYSRFQMMEMRRDDIRHFAGSYRHTLLKQGSELQIKLQRVDMTNGQAAYDYVLQAWV